MNIGNQAKVKIKKCHIFQEIIIKIHKKTFHFKNFIYACNLKGKSSKYPVKYFLEIKCIRKIYPSLV